MHFTKEDFKKIENYIGLKTIKDTQFSTASQITGAEQVPVIQDSINKLANLQDIIKVISNSSDVYNLTAQRGVSKISIEDALQYIPSTTKKLGLIITFYNDYNVWVVYQFTGTNLSQFANPTYWTLLWQDLESYVGKADEEDITEKTEGRQKVFKFRDRAKGDPNPYTSVGYKILRVDEQGPKSCSLTDDEGLINVLTQDMINESNTIYEIRYDFVIENGGTILIPDGCVLFFNGGHIDGGTLDLKNTYITGLADILDMSKTRDVKLQTIIYSGVREEEEESTSTGLNLTGTPKTGQISVFTINYIPTVSSSYKNILPIISVKDSIEEVVDGDEIQEEVNTDLSITEGDEESRNILAFWDGETWRQVMDDRQYDELLSLITGLYDYLEKYKEELENGGCVCREINDEELTKLFNNTLTSDDYTLEQSSTNCDCEALTTADIKSVFNSVAEEEEEKCKCTAISNSDIVSLFTSK